MTMRVRYLPAPPPLASVDLLASTCFTGSKDRYQTGPRWKWQTDRLCLKVTPSSFPISQMNMWWKVNWQKLLLSLSGWRSQAGNFEIGQMLGRILVLDESVQLVSRAGISEHVAQATEAVPLPNHLFCFIPLSFFLSVFLPTRHLHPTHYSPS